VSKFPTTMKMDIKINTLYHAMLSALEATRVNEPVAFSEMLLAAADMLFMLN